MTKIDFYILAQDSPRNIEQLTCQLTEKAYLQHNFVYIQSQSIEQANNVDELLWNFKASSFLPHLNLMNPLESNNQTAKEFSYPILINTTEDFSSIIAAKKNYNPENKPELLINLTTKQNDSFSSFNRLIEIVDRDEASKQAARERFRFYKDRGYEISTHNL